MFCILTSVSPPKRQAILKTNRWREQYGVENLENLPELQKHNNKARVLRHRDCIGRPVIYIPAKNHNSSDRDIDELTKFIVKCLEEACKKCFEEVTDNLCIVFDLAEFNTTFNIGLHECSFNYIYSSAFTIPCMNVRLAVRPCNLRVILNEYSFFYTFCLCLVCLNLAVLKIL